MDLKNLVKLARTAHIQYGAFEATGAPAVLVAVAGLVLAAGSVRVAALAAPLAPETLRELRTILEVRAAQRERALLRS